MLGFAARRHSDTGMSIRGHALRSKTAQLEIGCQYWIWRSMADQELAGPFVDIRLEEDDLSERWTNLEA
eukprot:5345741-Amphidinium_carterae.1